MKLYTVAGADEEGKNRWSFAPYLPVLFPCRVGLKLWQGPTRPYVKREKVNKTLRIKRQGWGTSHARALPSNEH